MNNDERMVSGKLFDPGKVKGDSWFRNREVIETFNQTPNSRHGEGMDLLRTIMGQLPDNAVIRPPFHCDKGSKIHIGENFYANTGLIILDAAKVEIGNQVFFGPCVSIYTVNHPIDAFVRSLGYEIAQSVKVGDHVWVGGNTVINPGVTIGDNVVIGSGSVVTKDIPANTVAAGNPCRVIREITEEDREYWNQMLEDYKQDADTPYRKYNKFKNGQATLRIV